MDKNGANGKQTSREKKSYNGICLTIVFSSNNKVDTKLDMHPRIIVIVGRRVTSSSRVRGKDEGGSVDSTNCNKVEWNGNKISTHKQ